MTGTAISACQRQSRSARQRSASRKNSWLRRHGNDATCVILLFIFSALAVRVCLARGLFEQQQDGPAFAELCGVIQLDAGCVAAWTVCIWAVELSMD